LSYGDPVVGAFPDRQLHHADDGAQRAARPRRRNLRAPLTAVTLSAFGMWTNAAPRDGAA
jgi:hypothetical protein